MNIHTYLTALEMVPGALRAARALGLEANHAANQYIMAATGVDILAAMGAGATVQEVAPIPAPPKPPTPPAQSLQPQGWDSAQIGEASAATPAAEPLPPSLARQTLYTPEQLGQQLGGVDAAEVNRLLSSMRLQEKRGGFLVPTPEGERHARWRSEAGDGGLSWSAEALELLRAKILPPQNLPATDVRACNLDEQACEACQ